MKPIVTSLLETDLYKFTMWQSLLHSHPNAQTEYAFVCRNTPAYPLSELKADVDRELDHLCALHFAEDELDYLRSLRFIKSDFTDFLTVFHFQRKFIKVTTNGDTLEIVATGPQVHVMGFEIYVLHIVNELYFRRLQTETSLQEGRDRLAKKIALVRTFAQEATRANPFEFFDFGLRRRFSGEWHDEVVATLKRELPDYFKGTSNVYLAKKHKLVPIGTMAHEYLQSYQSFGVRLRDFQKAALEDWVQEYRGDLGTALTDVVGMDAFLADFDLYFAKLFDGLRHDSGDPIIWGEKALAHYAKLRVDAHTKRLVFSDGLDFDKAFSLYRHFADRTMTGFGIGTNLTNDTGIKALNIVMKLKTCNGQPVAKLSDSAGKTLCTDETFLAYLRQVFNHPVI
ncbi:nicotinate phosphoribosyltransferase [Undibacterium sp. RTI2.1]|uniref:nicotinate phosphoribosyltransferase n=1 Tax=unclassified Undibacterium TaxID=2630295 RepID=UPI002AB40049|nr:MULTISPECIES: nicotinate phosphoribosyltransferase [unclassified Undibacterium]MDY7539668.1 nicotinate phosphoribosyltransferase [Undibacterium sp. 5I1]MEB0030685.1 nicotinate phosphoribosyltransferase [Undibacterium sp. RTI2.1]MEB0117196.1 nicotinate phosphoribosyltransferase [Undibacterium sp. RTI2.2]MEB0233157.1 nicotinate phosphoribosyltransferase [Undibacterium sp. 10I3]MEB0257443.1 nicotinate phosphoribosyltransferase [Undibacterium sp. 5I1]